MELCKQVPTHLQTSECSLLKLLSPFEQTTIGQLALRVRRREVWMMEVGNHWYMRVSQLLQPQIVSYQSCSHMFQCIQTFLHISTKEHSALHTHTTICMHHYLPTHTHARTHTTIYRPHTIFCTHVHIPPSALLCIHTHYHLHTHTTICTPTPTPTPPTHN